MKTPLHLLPDLRTLTARLTAALNRDGASSRVRVLKRKLPRFMSTFPNEIVTCVLPNGRKRRLFMKYEAGCGHNSYGHRGDVGYEAEVYQQVLRPLPDFRPECLGAYNVRKTGDTWLILEYVYNAVRVSDLSYHRSTRQPRALVESARWIAQFHDTQAARLKDPALSFLRRYDAEYYRGWARRMFEFAAPLRDRFPWLDVLRKTGDAWFAPLLTAPPTLIHGEFYSKTVLARGQKLFVVDWESAAIAAGEIDLAALTEGKHWTGRIAHRCEREYQYTRWPKGPPADFKRRLDAARIYLHFRWLGERPEWAVREKTLWRYAHLHAAAERLGLIV